MAHFPAPRLERPTMTDLGRRYPWLAVSVLTHVVLVAALYTAGPVRVQLKRDAGIRARVDASLQQTAQRQMQRQLRSMEEIKEALEQSAGGAAGGKGNHAGSNSAAAPAKDPAQRARELASAIEAVQQKIRAAEMARVLRIPEQEALKRVKAEAAQRPKTPLPKGQPPEAVVAKLAAQARAALAQRRSQLAAQQQGVRLSQGRAGEGAGFAQAGQGGRMLRGGGGANATQSTGSQSHGARLDALASGLEMGTPGALRGSSLDMSGEGFSDQRSYGAFLKPPFVDAAAVHPGAGRKLGAGGVFANRIFLDTWYVIGPFQSRGRDSIDAVYPPERGVVLDAVYSGKNDLPVRWTWQQEASYPFVPRPRADNAVYYAYTEVTVDEDVDMWMDIGADDDSKLWFNERLVWISGDGDKPWYRQAFDTLDTELKTMNLTEGQRKLRFHKGRNTILLKLYNGANLMFFSVVLAPAD
jgi:hypothetical protein